MPDKGEKRREKAIYIDTQIGQDIFPNFLRRSALCIVPDLGPSFMQASALVNNTVSSILLSLFFSEHSDVKKTMDLLFHPPCIISRKDE